MLPGLAIPQICGMEILQVAGVCIKLRFAITRGKKDWKFSRFPANGKDQISGFKNFQKDILSLVFCQAFFDGHFSGSTIFGMKISSEKEEFKRPFQLIKRKKRFNITINPKQEPIRL